VPTAGESWYQTSERVLFSASDATTRVKAMPLRVTVLISRSLSVSDRVDETKTSFCVEADVTTFDSVVAEVPL